VRRQTGSSSRATGVEAEGVVGGRDPEGKQKALPVLIEHGRDGWLSERLMRYELDLKFDMHTLPVFGADYNPDFKSAIRAVRSRLR
jgi:hypothetical protein